MGLGILVQLRHHARTQPQRDAIATASGALTYAEVLPRVEAAARALIASGVGAGTVVGISIADEAEHLIASLALFVAGARQMALATFDPETVRMALAKRVGVTHVVAASAAFALDGTRLVQWPAAPVADMALPAEEGSIFLRTSGTTGGSNIIELLAEQLEHQSRIHPRHPERLLRLSSIEHNDSKRHRLYCVLAGGTNVFRPEELADIAAFCLETGVTCLDCARMHAAGLAGTLDGRRLADLTICISGAPTPIALRRTLESNVTPHLDIRYGTTECGTIAIASDGEHDDDETVGRPLVGLELQIVDPDGRPLPQGETGEIRLRTAGMATSYFDTPEQTAQRFRDGWFWPGDMGALRADGHLIVKGRKDDMMILNGLNIFPAEIERVLEQHEAVSIAAALPLTSGVHGQIPVAAVELRPNATVSAAELQAYARGQLALRAPRRILIMDVLPRNAQGKILRREIAAAFQPKVGPS